MKTLLLSIACLCLSFLQAQTILDESFNYGTTAGSLCGTGGVTTNWTPHISAGITPVLYTATSLVYAGYGAGSSIGNGAVTFANAATARENVNRTLPLINSGSVYISFLLKVTGASSGGPTASSDYVLHFNDTFGSTLTGNAVGRIFVKNAQLNPYYNVGLSKGSTGASVVYSATNYSASSTVLVVMKYMFNTSSSIDDSVYAWIFTSGVPTTEPAPLLTATDMTVADLAQIRSLCIRQGTASFSNGSIDGIKVGLTWPSTLLPVKWLDFSAKQIDNNVMLNWSTASETNNDHFEIERCNSAECLHNEATAQLWSTVGTVKGNGNTNSISYYQFHDFSVSPGNTNTLYYRMKQVDFDGHIQYSKVVSVELNKIKNADPVIYPNPFSNEIIIHASEPSILNITDINGKTIIHQQISPNEKLSTEHLIPGIYFVEVANSSGIKHVKMMK